jgi:hypothetical protein
VLNGGAAGPGPANSPSVVPVAPDVGISPALAPAEQPSALVTGFVSGATEQPASPTGGGPANQDAVDHVFARLLDGPDDALRQL